MARISPGTMTAAVFAILIGLGGAYAVRQYLHQPPVEQVAQEEPAAPQAIYVPIAIQDLPVGRTLAMTDIQIIQYTPETFAKSKYAKLPFLSDTDGLIGRTLQNEVKRGTSFDPAVLFPQGMGPGIATLLEPGYRAATVPIPDVGAIAGFARPGAIVDVLFRSQAHEGYPEITMTLLDRVKVLAVDQQMQAGQQVELEPALDVTLAVTPGQAKALKVVEGRGTLSLTLRGDDDFTEFTSFNGHQARSMTMEQLLGLPYMTRRTTMEVYRGNDLTTKTFEEHVRVDDRSGNLISTPIAAEVPLIGSPQQAVKQLPGDAVETGGAESGGAESGGSGS